MSARYAYFAGCSAKGSCQELDVSTRAVAELFDIAMVELESPGCTGAREFRAIGEQLHLVANGRILALAEATGVADLVVVCDTCLLNLTEVNARLRSDAVALDMVNETLATVGLRYGGGVGVKHFLWVLMDDVGPDRLRAGVVRPLRGLRVAPFYGCHLIRPASAYPDGARGSLEALCGLLGAQAVPYDGATGCCGFHVVLTEQRVALGMSGRHLERAKASGADCMVTPCPLCHTVLDAYQPNAEKQLATRIGLPVLHVSQLVGLAMGLDPKRLRLSRHVVDAMPVARALGL